MRQSSSCAVAAIVLITGCLPMVGPEDFGECFMGPWVGFEERPPDRMLKGDTVTWTARTDCDGGAPVWSATGAAITFSPRSQRREANSFYSSGLVRAMSIGSGELFARVSTPGDHFNGSAGVTITVSDSSVIKSIDFVESQVTVRRGSGVGTMPLLRDDQQRIYAGAPTSMSSSDESVATIGYETVLGGKVMPVVRGRGVGVATITARFLEASGSYTVYVVNP